MYACRLVGDFCQHAGFGIDFEDGDAVILQSVAGVEVFAVGTEMDVCATTRTKRVGGNSLYLFQFSLQITESYDVAREFANEVGIFSIGAERQMTRTEIRFHLDGFGRRVGDEALGMHDEAQNAVGTEVGGEDVVAIRREDSAMHVGCGLSIGIRSSCAPLEEAVGRFQRTVFFSGNTDMLPLL